MSAAREKRLVNLDARGTHRWVTSYGQTYCADCGLYDDDLRADQPCFFSLDEQPRASEKEPD